MTTNDAPGQSAIQAGLDDALRLTAWLRDLEARQSAIAHLADRLVACLRNGGRVLACGNGGSMSDAMHFAQELSGRFRSDRPALAVQAISDPAHITCVANDYGFEAIFARGVEAWGTPGDVLVVFSTSGRSPNIVKAAQTARSRGLAVVGLLGRDGGDTQALCDDAIVVPGSSSDRIQEVHIKIAHLVIDTIERQLFPSA